MCQRWRGVVQRDHLSSHSLVYCKLCIYKYNLVRNSYVLIKCQFGELVKDMSHIVLDPKEHGSDFGRVMSCIVGSGYDTDMARLGSTWLETRVSCL